MGPGDHHEVDGDQDREDRGQDEHVRDEHPGEEVGRPRELPVPDERGERRTDDGDRERDGVPDCQAHPREQVVEEGVAQIALQDGDHEHRQPHVIVEVTGLPEGAGEEDPHQVQHDRRDEDQRGPVMRLPHE